MTLPAPIFAAHLRRIFLAKIVCIPRRGYSKRTIFLSFAIVGLRGEDGTEYVEEVTGGEGSGKIGGIPAGSYEVFVRNSESNNEFKDTTTETLDITGAMNFVAGQRLQEGISYLSH